ncbi:hypothetical protein BD311DRAFT_433298 [Dichomitus squalens]|uniref:Uncharacterized protein n=1 Tax=Dichomitus squalens TaxID=114155 RepID=A0A4Q9MYZ9_9APHY|nr:hypothetical protein BD311DRAFT_433298 [Dichomitus squalens]
MAAIHQPRTKKAERINDQLFPLFFRTFQTGTVAEFATTADKLANWLKVDKAYYSRARPTIVELLETAHDTVRRHSEDSELPFHVSRVNDGVRPYAEPFVRLVRTVAPFYPLFPEPHLQMRLRDIFQTICDDVAEFLSQPLPFHRGSTTPSAVTTRTTPPSPPAHSPVTSEGPTALSLTQGLTTQETSVHLPPAHTTNFGTPPTTSNPLQLLSSGPSPFIAKISGSSDITSTSSSPRTATPTMPQTNQVAAPAAPVPPVASSPTTATATSHSTRPKVKKKKLAFDDFIEADLNWYKDKHSTQAQDSLPPTPRATSEAVTSSIGTSSALVAQLTEPMSGRLASPPMEVPQSIQTDAVPVLDPSTATLDTQTSRSPSVPLQDVVSPKSRSPSVPLRFVVKPHLKRKAPDDDVDLQEARVESRPRSRPQSPTLLPPSLTRRPTPSVLPPVVAADKEETDVRPNPPTPANDPPPSSGALPSPLATKKEKRKKRKGPPGLRVLPLHPLTEEQLKEKLDTEGALQDLPVVRPSRGKKSNKEEGQLESESKSRSWTPPPELPQEEPSFGPISDARQTTEPSSAAAQGSERAASPQEAARVHTSAPVDLPSDIVLEETVAFAASPDAMEVDAALELPRLSVGQDPAAPDTPEGEKGAAAAEDVSMGETAQSGEILLGDDVTMQVDSPAEPMDGSSTPAGHSSAVHPAPSVEEPGHSNGDATYMNGTKAIEPPARSPVHASLPSTSAIEPQEDRMDPQASPFASRLVRLLSLERGHPSHTSPREPVELNFTLTDEEMLHIARWNDRENSTSDLSASMCVSLVSYPLEQCAKAFNGDPYTDQEDIDVVGFGCPRSWPQDGSIYVVLDVSGERGPPRSINVAPPFGFNTLHRPVDLGGHGVHPGDNTLHLFQFRDHSDCIFAVVLHRPTVEQLAEVEAVLKRERALEDWIEGLGSFNLPTPRLLHAPNGNVVSDG